LSVFGIKVSWRYCCPFSLIVASPFFFGTKGADVPIGQCPILVQHLLVLFETAILGTKITCVIFGTKCFGIFISNCYFWYKIFWYCYLKLLFLVRKLCYFVTKVFGIVI
jgi:hypothetical protein